MKKLYVITSYAGRTDEEIQAARNRVHQKVMDLYGEEIELLLPTSGMKRLTAEIDSVLNADMVVAVKYFEYSIPSRIAWQAAQDYIQDCHDEKWLDIMLENKLVESQQTVNIPGNN